jgi:hypothetical protein
MVMEDGEDMTRTTMEVDTGAMAVMELVSEFCFNSIGSFY